MGSVGGVSKGCDARFVIMGVLATLACSSPPAGDSVAGEALFHDRTPPGLGGNGRACSDCHTDASGFQVGPVDVEARYQQMVATGIDDPLFRPIDADDFAANGPLAADYTNLRSNGLFRIRMPLPANIKLVEPTSCTTAGVPAPCQSAENYAVSTATFTDVWRAVPSVLNVVSSGPDRDGPTWPRGPNPQGGYQLDGRVDTLQHQALGAFQSHSQVAVDPTPKMLDDVTAYETGLRATAEPPLTELQAAGKVVFQRACTQCHGGPGLSRPLVMIRRYFDDLVACPRSVDTVSPARWDFGACPAGLVPNQQTYEISFTDGYKARRTSSDPGRALLSGYVASAPLAPDGSCAHLPCGEEFEDDWQKFDTSPLNGISRTAPYFHNNSAATLEAVAIHYEELFKRVEALFPPPLPLPPVLTTDGIHADRPNVSTERAALVAYLQVL